MGWDYTQGATHEARIRIGQSSHRQGGGTPMTDNLPEMVEDPQGNRIKFELAKSILPTERDREKFEDYFLGVLFNYLDDNTLSYCIGQAFKCWSEIHQVQREGQGRLQ